jgi:hypothetical protein
MFHTSSLFITTAVRASLLLCLFLSYGYLLRPARLAESVQACLQDDGAGPSQGRTHTGTQGHVEQAHVHVTW